MSKVYQHLIVMNTNKDSQDISLRYPVNFSVPFVEFIALSVINMKHLI